MSSVGGGRSRPELSGTGRGGLSTQPASSPGHKAISRCPSAGLPCAPRRHRNAIARPRTCSVSCRLHRGNSCSLPRRLGALGAGQGRALPHCRWHTSPLGHVCWVLGSGHLVLGLGGSPATGLPGQKPHDIPWGRGEVSPVTSPCGFSDVRQALPDAGLQGGSNPPRTRPTPPAPTPTPVTQPLSPVSRKAHHSLSSPCLGCPFRAGYHEGHRSDQSHH